MRWKSTMTRLVRWGMIASAVIWMAACADGAGQQPAAHYTPPAGGFPTTLPARGAIVNTDAAIDRIISKMTLDQKIGQLLMVEYLGTEYNNYLDGMVRGAHAGGIIMYSNDSATAEGMRQLLKDSQDNADFPLLISTDQEGGGVARLDPFFGPDQQSQWVGDLAEEPNAPELAKAAGTRDAKEMLDLGFNVDLAPVVDVGEFATAVEYKRLWSDSPQTTIDLAGQYLDGLQSAGGAGTLKHWPGIGTLPFGSDPHLVLPVMNRTLDQLNTIDFVPFKALISHGPALIMTTHVLVPAVDPDWPVTLSPKFINDILRGQLGFQGAVITDALHMKGVIDAVSEQTGLTDFDAIFGEVGVRAVLAGNDILEGAFDPYSAQVMLSAIRDAVNNGRIPLSRIEESDRRIFRLKWAYNIGLDRLMAAAGPDPIPATQKSASVAPSFDLAVVAADMRRVNG